MINQLATQQQTAVYSETKEQCVSDSKDANCYNKLSDPYFIIIATQNYF